MPLQSEKENEMKLREEIKSLFREVFELPGYGPEEFLADLQHGGCSSGMVPSLIYYSDTCSFFKRHRAEIGAVIATALDELGANSISELVRFFDPEDPLCTDIRNQNTLAWFTVEYLAEELCQELCEELQTELETKEE